MNWMIIEDFPLGNVSMHSKLIQLLSIGKNYIFEKKNIDMKTVRIQKNIPLYLMRIISHLNLTEYHLRKSLMMISQ